MNSEAAKRGPADRWVDAQWAAAIFALDPHGIGGAALRVGPGPGRDRWLLMIEELLPHGVPVRRIPLGIDDDRLLGGLDLVATISAQRPIIQDGVLALADGGVIVLSMAERMNIVQAARIATVMDLAEVRTERHGASETRVARFGVILLDEGREADEHPAHALLDRVAFHVEFDPAMERCSVHADPLHTHEACERARSLLQHVTIDGASIDGLCSTALVLGIDSIRACLLAIRTARASAALAGRRQVSSEDVVRSARLVLAPRATRIPPRDLEAAPQEDERTDNANQNSNGDLTPPPDADSSEDDSSNAHADVNLAELGELVLAAAIAVIPDRLLERFKADGVASRGAGSAGQSGKFQRSAMRGRASGVRRDTPGNGARLNLVATICAAAPWQSIRRRQSESANERPSHRARRVYIRRDDFHVTRRVQRTQSITVFAVDASGSSALHRLAEAKGAVELLLADCYIRRDRVALVAFRGRSAEILLEPTRSLVRAKRSLAGLPGGGGTPLALGIESALQVAQGARRQGQTALIVLLTDGRANVARDGTPGRERATLDALAAARSVRLAGFEALLLDTSPQPQASALALSAEMGGEYVPLPYANSATLSAVIKGAAARKSGTAG